MSQQKKPALTRRQFGRLAVGVVAGLIYEGCSDSSSKGFIPPSSGGGTTPQTKTVAVAIDTNLSGVGYDTQSATTDYVATFNSRYLRAATQPQTSKTVGTRIAVFVNGQQIGGVDTSTVVTGDKIELQDLDTSTVITFTV